MGKEPAVRINPLLLEKIKESLSSVLPITAIVLALSVSIVPLTTGALVLFLFGALLLIAGVGVFTLGVDMSMTPMGSAIGMYMSRARHRSIPLAVAFVLGLLITVAEPDLTVLAEQVPAIPNWTLILTVAAGPRPAACDAEDSPVPAAGRVLSGGIRPGHAGAQGLHPRLL